MDSPASNPEIPPEVERAFRQLQRANAELRLAQRIAGIGTWSLDPAVGVPVWSDVIYDIYERERSLGPIPLVEYQKTYSSPHLEKFTTSIEHAIQDGIPYDIELQLHLSPNRTKWIHAICEPEPEPGPAGHVLHGTIQDITELKQIAEALRDRRVELEQIFEALPDALVYADADRRVIRVNESFVQLFGYTPREVLGQSTEMFYTRHEDFVEQGRRRFNVNARNVFAPYEITYRHKDGSTFLSETVGTPVRDASDRVVGLLALIRDISERKQAEAALRESEERFRLLLNDIPNISVQGYAADGTTRYWNEGSRRLCGYTAAEAIGRSLLDLIIPPEMRDEVAAAARTMVETGTAIPPGELWLLRKDGSRVPVYSSHCVVQRSGHPAELFCIDIDLSEVKAAEQEREELLSQLAQAQKMESVGRLAGGVAHDFNNMLSVIIGRAELALARVSPESPLHGDLTEICTAAERSANLTRQLLAFARQQTAQPHVLNLNDALDATLTMLRRLVGEDVELRWKPAPALDPIRIDPAQIDQIITNLVVNARDALTGRGIIEIATESAPASAFALDSCARVTVLSVSDDGSGMDEATQRQIFDPFFSTKAVGQGTGLGLATVYGIVTQNHGTIQVNSTPDVGTTFRVALPVWQADDDSADVAQSDSSAAPRASGGETILLVEDEPEIVSMGQEMLQNLGYRVLAATTPDKALLLTEQHHGTIDLVITDVIMPQMNGRELAERLLESHPHLKVVFMSGYPANVVADRGLIDGDIQLLQKPFSMAQLTSCIDRALGKTSGS